MTGALGDTAALTGRTLRHVVRSPDTIITTAIQPIAIMLMFVYVLGGAIDAGPGPYIDYQLPGILLITVAVASAYTSYRLFMDLSTGVLERFRSMPIARLSVLWSHVLAGLTASGAAVGVVCIAAVIMGFRTDGDWLAMVAAAGLLAAFTLALTWLAVIVGLTAKTADGVSALAMPLTFLPFISSAFVPTDSMPGPVGWFAQNQPVTPIVDTLRSLLAGEGAGDAAWLALGWCGVILAAAMAAATGIYRRQVR